MVKGALTPVVARLGLLYRHFLSPEYRLLFIPGLTPVSTPGSFVS